MNRYTTHHYHVAITLDADEIAPSPDEVQEALFGVYTDADGIGVEWALKVPQPVDEAGSCILTGEPGENPDDCSTHDHAGYEHQDIVQGHGEDAE